MADARFGDSGADLRRIYARLLARFGHAGWWPGRSALEICIGAILTQNTSWANVEKAIAELRRHGALSWRVLHTTPVDRLARLVRSSGTYNVKARRLRAFLDFLGGEYRGRIAAMTREDPRELRARLLAVDGIGRETADSIVLYAAGLPLFVVDAYTRRVFARLGLIRGDEPYDTIQAFFMERLGPDAVLFNDYHAQIVRLAREVCRPRPRCASCPLDDRCAKRGV
jgi:endonuclease III related protein